MLIFDRTIADVNRAKQLIAKGYANLTAEEKAEYDAGFKGCYSYKDINRVNLEVNAIAEQLSIAGYKNNIKAKTNWTADAIWLVQDVKEYIEKVANLLQIYYTVGIDVPTNIVGYAECNDIERILHELKLTINRMQQSYRYLGTYHSSQDFNF